MTDVPPASPAALQEFKEFLTFLRNLWTMLAGVSVLFPLSNTFTKLIPLAQWSDGGALVYVTPAVVSGCATLTCLFIVLWTFGQREDLRKRRAWQTLARRALRSFAAGAAALVLYLGAYIAIGHDFYWGVLGWESGDLRRLAGDGVLLIAYTAFFALMTRAFLALGLREYLRDKRQPA